MKRIAGEEAKNSEIGIIFVVHPMEIQEAKVFISNIIKIYSRKMVCRILNFISSEVHTQLSY